MGPREEKKEGGRVALRIPFSKLHERRALMTRGGGGEDNRGKRTVLLQVSIEA